MNYSSSSLNISFQHSGQKPVMKRSASLVYVDRIGRGDIEIGVDKRLRRCKRTKLLCNLPVGKLRLKDCQRKIFCAERDAGTASCRGHISLYCLHFWVNDSAINR